MQNTIVKALTKLNQLKDQERAEIWLFSIAKSEMFTILRNRRQYVKWDFYEDSQENNELEKKSDFQVKDILDTLERKQTYSNLYEAMSRLKADHRRLIELRYFWEYREKQIAQITGKDYTVVRVTLRRALQELRDIYRKSKEARIGSEKKLKPGQAEVTAVKSQKVWGEEPELAVCGNLRPEKNVQCW